MKRQIRLPVLSFTQKFLHSLTAHAIKGAHVVLQVRVQIGPEFDQEEGVLRPLLVQLLQAAGLLRELVVDLLHVHRFEERVRWLLCYVHEQVLVILQLKRN